MAKDFGDTVLPLQHGGFLAGSKRAAQATFRWFDILWVLDDLRRTSPPLKGPLWTTGLGIEGGNAVVMFIPSASVIARRWAADITQQTSLVIQGSVSAADNNTAPTGSTETA